MSSLSITNRRRFINDHGFEIFEYSGKLKDAPGTLKHLLRDYPDGGLFVIHQGSKKVYPLPPAPAGLTIDQTYDWLINEAFVTALYSMLSLSGWVLLAIFDGKVTPFDDRKQKTWTLSPRDYDQMDEGYYLVNASRTYGPRMTHGLVIEDVAEVEGVLDGYMIDLDTGSMNAVTTAVPATRHPLIGKRFISFVDSAIRWHGVVLDGDLRAGFIVQLYPWQDGGIADQKFVERADIKDWSFYDTDADLTEALRSRLSA